MFVEVYQKEKDNIKKRQQKMFVRISEKHLSIMLEVYKAISKEFELHWYTVKTDIV